MSGVFKIRNKEAKTAPVGGDLPSPGGSEISTSEKSKKFSLRWVKQKLHIKGKENSDDLYDVTIQGDAKPDVPTLSAPPKPAAVKAAAAAEGKPANVPRSQSAEVGSAMRVPLQKATSVGAGDPALGGIDPSLVKEPPAAVPEEDASVNAVSVDSAKQVDIPSEQEDKVEVSEPAEAAKGEEAVAQVEDARATVTENPAVEVPAEEVPATEVPTALVEKTSSLEPIASKVSSEKSSTLGSPEDKEVDRVTVVAGEGGAGVADAADSENHRLLEKVSATVSENATLKKELEQLKASKAVEGGVAAAEPGSSPDPNALEELEELKKQKLSWEEQKASLEKELEALKHELSLAQAEAERKAESIPAPRAVPSCLSQILGWK